MPKFGSMSSLSSQVQNSSNCCSIVRPAVSSPSDHRDPVTPPSGLEGERCTACEPSLFQSEVPAENKRRSCRPPMGAMLHRSPGRPIEHTPGISPPGRAHSGYIELPPSSLPTPCTAPGEAGVGDSGDMPFGAGKAGNRGLFGCQNIKQMELRQFPLLFHGVMSLSQYTGRPHLLGQSPQNCYKHMRLACGSGFLPESAKETPQKRFGE